MKRCSRRESAWSTNRARITSRRIDWIRYGGKGHRVVSRAGAGSFGHELGAFGWDGVRLLWWSPTPSLSGVQEVCGPYSFGA